ncbi:hypothetical protein BH10PSE12_BH10PSE12_23450 [soil metagenome]
MGGVMGRAGLRACLPLGVVLLLSACLVTPGTFDSTLDIRADRSFAFTYKGEVIALNMDKAMQGGASPDTDDMPEGEDSAYQQIVLNTGAKPQKPARKPSPPITDADNAGFADAADDTTKMEAIATALSKEKGFRSARYDGGGKFEIDYAITGTLTHAFVFPFNIDAQIVFPFIAIELRGDDKVRVKAPGYANSDDKLQGPMGSGAAGQDAAKALNGTFTLTTNAAIVSQNQEDGPSAVPGGQRILWKVDPLTREAPMAVLKFPGK